MVRYCCILGCNSKYSKNKDRILFRIPKKTEIRQQWIRLIENKMKDHTIKNIDYVHVCDLHFEKHQVQRYYVLQEGNNITSLIPRTRPSLIKSCVPSIFPDSLQSTIINEKEKTDDMNIVNIKSKVVDSTDTSIIMNTKEEHIIADNEIHLDELVQPSTTTTLMNIDPEHTQSIEYDYETFIHEIESLDTSIINNMWTIIYFPTGVHFLHYTDNWTYLHKSIFVKSSDMTTEIRIEGVVCKNLVNKIGCLQDFLSLVAHVEQIILCSGIDNNTPCPHDGYFLPQNLKSPRCLLCRKKRKNKLNTISLRKRRLEIKRTKRLKYFKKLRNSNAYLKAKMFMMKLKLKKIKTQYVLASERAVDDALKNLPPVQQKAIKACLKAAKTKSQTRQKV